MRRSALALIVAAAALILPVARAGVAPAQDAHAEDASAHRVLLRDGRGDVWRSDELDGSWTKAGRVPSADVLRFRAYHGPANLRFRLWFDDLKRWGYADYYIVIKTPNDLHYANVEALGGKGSHHLLNIEGDPERSRGMTHKIRYVRDTLTVVVPRALLSKPEWVRVAAVNQMWAKDRSFYLEDNPVDHGHHDLGVPRSVRLYRA